MTTQVGYDFNYENQGDREVIQSVDRLGQSFNALDRSAAGAADSVADVAANNFAKQLGLAAAGASKLNSEIDRLEKQKAFATMALNSTKYLRAQREARALNQQLETAIRGVVEETEVLKEKGGIAWTEFASKIDIVTGALGTAKQTLVEVFDLAGEGGTLIGSENAFEQLGASAQVQFENLEGQFEKIFTDTDLKRIISFGDQIGLTAQELDVAMNAVVASAQKSRDGLTDPFNQVIDGLRALNKGGGGIDVLENLGVTMGTIDEIIRDTVPNFDEMSERQKEFERRTATLDFLLEKSFRPSLDGVDASVRGAAVSYEEATGELKKMLAEFLVSTGFLDGMKRAFGELSTFVHNNRDQIKEWGTTIKDVATFAWNELSDSIRTARVGIIETGAQLELASLQWDRFGLSIEQAGAQLDTWMTQGLNELNEVVGDAFIALGKFFKELGVGGEGLIDFGQSIQETGDAVERLSEAELADVNQRLDENAQEMVNVRREADELKASLFGVADATGTVSEEMNELQMHAINLTQSFTSSIEGILRNRNPEGKRKKKKENKKDVLNELFGFDMSDVRFEVGKFKSDVGVLIDDFIDFSTGKEKATRNANHVREVRSLLGFDDLTLEGVVQDVGQFFTQAGVFGQVNDLLNPSDAEKAALEHDLKMERLGQMRESIAGIGEETDRLMGLFEGGDPMTEAIFRWSSGFTDAAQVIVGQIEEIASAQQSEMKGIKAVFGAGAGAVATFAQSVIKDQRAQAAISGALMIAKAAQAVAEGVFTNDPSKFVAAGLYTAASIQYFVVAGQGSGGSGGGRGGGGGSRGIGRATNDRRSADFLGQADQVDVNSGRGGKLGQTIQIFVSTLESSRTAGENIARQLNKLGEQNIGVLLDKRVIGDDQAFMGW